MNAETTIDEYNINHPEMSKDVNIILAGNGGSSIPSGYEYVWPIIKSIVTSSISFHKHSANYSNITSSGDFWLSNYDTEKFYPEDGNPTLYVFSDILTYGWTSIPSKFLDEYDGKYILHCEIFTNQTSSNSRCTIVYPNAPDFTPSSFSYVYNNSNGIGLGFQSGKSQIISKRLANSTAITSTVRSLFNISGILVDFGDFYLFDGKNGMKDHQVKINDLYSFSYSTPHDLLVYKDSSNNNALVCCMFGGQILPVYSASTNSFIIDDYYLYTFCYIIDPKKYNTTDWWQSSTGKVNISAFTNNLYRRTNTLYSDINENVVVSTFEYDGMIGGNRIIIHKTNEPSDYFR